MVTAEVPSLLVPNDGFQILVVQQLQVTGRSPVTASSMCEGTVITGYCRSTNSKCEVIIITGSGSTQDDEHLCKKMGKQSLW